MTSCYGIVQSIKKLVYVMNRLQKCERWQRLGLEIESNTVCHWLGANLESSLVYIFKSVTRASLHVSNHQKLDCLKKKSFRLTTKKTSNLNELFFVRGIHPKFYFITSSCFPNTYKVFNVFFISYRLLVQGRRNYVVNTLELRLSCTNPSI